MDVATANKFLCVVSFFFTLLIRLLLLGYCQFIETSRDYFLEKGLFTLLLRERPQKEGFVNVGRKSPKNLPMHGQIAGIPSFQENQLQGISLYRAPSIVHKERSRRKEKKGIPTRPARIRSYEIASESFKELTAGNLYYFGFLSFFGRTNSSFISEGQLLHF